MKSAIQNILSEIRSSYWYIPLMMLIMAIILASITLQLDEMQSLDWIDELGWLSGKNPDGARSFLSNIASAMITVASVTFSMTLLAVSFAASQIGPRLTSNFMRDTTNQLSLGTFIATFMYCLIIMRSIVNNNTITADSLPENIFVPQISLFIALLLAITSLLVLVYFIHHISESINMSNVVARVGESLFDQTDDRFPIGVGKEKNKNDIKIPQDYHQHVIVVPAKQHGYIRILDAESLIKHAKEQDCIVKLQTDIGQFIIEESPLLTIYSRTSISEDLIETCQKVYAVGFERNQEQDLDFLVHELIEIIVRALSPGVNDPYSAMNALDWLYLFLQKIANKTSPSRARYDSEGQLRLLVSLMDFYYYLSLIFTHTRQYICKDYITSAHALKILRNLAVTIPEEFHTFLHEQEQLIQDDVKINMQGLSIAKALKQ